MNDKLKKLIDEYDNILIGAGAGLSIASGFEYGGKTFIDNFKYMHDRYGYTDMYTAGFHNFKNSEEKWTYWSKMIYLNRYSDSEKALYKRLYNLIKDKNYFVITTNVDHQFQKNGFDKERLFYMQGDYGLFQCSTPCHNKTYDNFDIIKKMISIIDCNHKIPSDLIPKCPICHKEMTTNLRCDNKFVEDEGWHLAKKRYDEYINLYKNQKILLLELGVGYSTPIWIKYPFINMTIDNKQAKYIVIDNGYVYIPDEIKNQTIIMNENINNVI
mgnify:CR=1 FL=1